MSTISAAELAARLEHQGHHATPTLVRQWLQDWEARGITEHRPDGWRLTHHGHAKYGHWATVPTNLEEAA